MSSRQLYTHGAFQLCQSGECSAFSPDCFCRSFLCSGDDQDRGIRGRHWHGRKCLIHPIMNRGRITAKKFADQLDWLIQLSMQINRQRLASSQVCLKALTIVWNFPNHLYGMCHSIVKRILEMLGLLCRQPSLYQWNSRTFRCADHPNTISHRAADNFDGFICRNVKPFALKPVIAQQNMHPMLDCYGVSDLFRPAQFELARVAALQRRETFDRVDGAADFCRTSVNFRNHVYRHENAPLFGIFNITESRIIGILENQDSRKINYFPEIRQLSCRIPEARTQNLVANPVGPHSRQNSKPPHPDIAPEVSDDGGRGLLRGIAFALLPALVLWALIIWAICWLL
jgi:hypothetical protein